MQEAEEAELAHNRELVARAHARAGGVSPEIGATSGSADVVDLSQRLQTLERAHAALKDEVAALRAERHTDRAWIEEQLKRHQLQRRPSQRIATWPPTDGTPAAAPAAASGDAFAPAATSSLLPRSHMLPTPDDAAKLRRGSKSSPRNGAASPAGGANLASRLSMIAKSAKDLFASADPNAPPEKVSV